MNRSTPEQIAAAEALADSLIVRVRQRDMDLEARKERRVKPQPVEVERRSGVDRRKHRSTE